MIALGLICLGLFFAHLTYLHWRAIQNGQLIQRPRRDRKTWNGSAWM